MRQLARQMSRQLRLILRGAILLVALTAFGAVGIASTSHGSGDVQSRGLTISMTHSPDPVVPNQLVTYIITVNNAGAAPQSAVSVVDLIGGGSIHSVNPSQGSCLPPEDTGFRCNLGEISPGSSVTISVEKFKSSVGGEVQLPVDQPSGPQSDEPSPSSLVSDAALAGGIAAVALAIAAVGWYTGRRFRQGRADEQH
jgi:uncharacterized repeat protein (TIGR01451 family)